MTLRIVQNIHKNIPGKHRKLAKRGETFILELWTMDILVLPFFGMLPGEDVLQ